MSEQVLEIEPLGPPPIPLEPRPTQPTVVLVVPAHNEEDALGRDPAG